MCQYDRIPYSSFLWKIGTTSFRTKEFNKSIEWQLRLLDEFWQKPENIGLGWEIPAQGQNGIYEIKNRYYDWLVENGFTIGNDRVKYKAAREKTSGLVDMGLIDNERRLTEAGRELLTIANTHSYEQRTELGIPKDSELYLRQLIKLSDANTGGLIRPFLIVVYLLSNLEYFTYDEFKYLLPLCISADTTEKILNSIRALREGRSSIDDIIVDHLLERSNYREGLNRFILNPFSESLLLSIGMNRKSATYDKPYYVLFQEMHSVYIDGNEQRIVPLFEAVNKISSSCSKKWKQLLFESALTSVVKGDPVSNIKQLPDEYMESEESFKRFFFVTMHLFKAKATLEDYFDLNRRYLNLSNCFIFDENQVKFDIVPKQYFRPIAEQLYEHAYEESELLYLNCPLSSINPLLAFNEQNVIAGINTEFGTQISNITEAYDEVERQRYLRFNSMLDSRFNKTTIVNLLDDFDSRNDSEISNLVTDNADIPTIFEYVIGIIWYNVSGRRGKVLDYLKLSLDANLLPITHAAGGEADIVYEYPTTNDYPQHCVLLEATLSDSVNQRRMEMEPVSRHLGNHLLRTGNYNSYCVFASSHLHINVISDFRGRKNNYYCDPQDPSKYISTMKIIPLSTEDLRTIVRNDLTYSELYVHFEQAFQSKENHPQKWYDEYVNLDNKISEYSEQSFAAENVYIYGSIPIDLPQIDREDLLEEQLDLLLMYAVGGRARVRTERSGKIALGIKESQLSGEQEAAYRSVKYLLFHYWSNPKVYELNQTPSLVDRNNVPKGYLIRQEDEAVKFLLLDYDPNYPVDLGKCNILRTQRKGEIRYLPFVTTLDSIRLA